ncbi:MAG: alpha-ketoglutarate-dependent dioxygenase AlkB [Ferruginibacter sp.]
MQQNLFHNAKNILPYDGAAYFYPDYFSNAEGDSFLVSLINEVNWKQEPIKMFGKEIMQPRLTAYCGDAAKPYSYSGITMQPQSWTGSLLAIKTRIEWVAGVIFTSALLNFYRDGHDSMGWHRDNEKELGINPVIASVSFGAARQFQYRDYTIKGAPISINLTHGSLLLMKGKTQHCWEHRLPKALDITGIRINITFRLVM